MNRAQTTGGRTRQARAEFWNAHLESWRHSGLSQVEYCRQNQLNRHTFGYWKSKVVKTERLPHLLPVSIRSDTPSNTPPYPSGVSLSFDNRFDIHLEIGFHGDTLTRLIDVLEAR